MLLMGMLLDLSMILLMLLLLVVNKLVLVLEQQLALWLDMLLLVLLLPSLGLELLLLGIELLVLVLVQSKQLDKLEDLQFAISFAPMHAPVKTLLVTRSEPLDPPRTYISLRAAAGARYARERTHLCTLHTKD